MTVATYVLEVMWDGAAWTDETTNLIQAEWRRGRDYASQLSGRATAGTFEAILQNPSGRYASLNASSPLYGLIKPGRKVRFRTTAPSAATLWTGFLEEIIPDPGGRRDAPQVTLRASGPLRWISDRDTAIARQTSILTGAAIGLILDDAGWPAGDRTIDAGHVTLSRWTADGDRALAHAREIEETEFGYLGESKDGKIVYEDVTHRLTTPHTASVATFSDAPGAALFYDEIRQLDPWREIYNRFSAEVTTYSVQALATLWSVTGEVPEIKPGSTRDFWAEYPTPDAPTQADSVDAWTTPVVGTDVVANAASDGSGANLNASISVAVSKFAKSMKISVTNGAAVSAFLTTLQARGTPVYRNDPIRVAVEDTTSQAAFGKKAFPLPGKFYPTTASAQSYVEFGLSRYKDPVAVLALSFQANASDAHMTQALSRDVSDRVTVVASGTGASGAQLGISRDFFVEAESHHYDLSGHWVTYELSDATADGGYWSLGVSTLGQTTRLFV